MTAAVSPDQDAWQPLQRRTASITTGCGAYGSGRFELTDTLEHDDLWTAEAAHRAKNFAQLTDALVAFHARAGGCDRDAVAHAGDALRNLYLTLADDPRSRVRQDCAPPLRTLTDGLVTLFGPVIGDVTARVVAEPLPLDPRRARALLLIASELIVNALRHAFPHGHGRIDVRLSPAGGHHLLSVRDDGVGLPAVGRSGVGSQIVSRLAGVLDGHVQTLCAATGGTCAELRFLAPSPEL